MAEPLRLERNVGGGCNVLDAAGYRIGHTARVCVPRREVVTEADAERYARLFAVAPVFAAALQRIAETGDAASRTLAREALATVPSVVNDGPAPTFEVDDNGQEVARG